MPTEAAFYDLKGAVSQVNFFLYFGRCDLDLGFALLGAAVAAHGVGDRAGTGAAGIADKGQPIGEALRTPLDTLRPIDREAQAIVQGVGIHVFRIKGEGKALRVVGVAALCYFEPILKAVLVTIGHPWVAAGVVGINEDSGAGLGEIEHPIAIGVGLRVDGGLGDGVGEEGFRGNDRNPEVVNSSGAPGPDCDACAIAVQSDAGSRIAPRMLALPFADE